MRWQQAGGWTVAARVAEWGGDTGGAATAFPAGCLAVVSSDVHARVFRVWAYSPDGGDFRALVHFGDVTPEDGTVYPTGRMDPTGVPVVLYHGGEVKFLVRAWNGGGDGPAPLLRVRTTICLG